ncbi:hypothetical protein BCF11_0016 [Collimonas sp. PA-H2]|uniref:hypothetical protein n=1 Tax=Collimonas sp. PA-H2 TaxID=1881062 RepID=UPI000BF6346C|nr:hypothetical protein [Collimonas sp. PA-H2]PFH07679.1 hypothetical protein BCF11_0016 [Collimonas sp. PA-H2]
MNVSGKDWVKLRIPQGYGFGNGAADAMEKYVYPNGRPKNSAAVSEELLLSALWPDMASHTRETDAEFSVGGGGRTMNVLMSSSAIDAFDGKHYNRLQTSFNVYVEDVRHVCTSPVNPDGTANEVVCHDRIQPDQKLPKFGLKCMGIDFRKYPCIHVADYGGLAPNDVYYAQDASNGLQTVITCAAEEAEAVEQGPVRFIPHCHHEFIFKPLNALVSIHYRREYLKDWQAIQAAWGKLLQSFMVQQKTIETPVARK